MKHRSREITRGRWLAKDPKDHSDGNDASMVARGRRRADPWLVCLLALCTRPPVCAKPLAIRAGKIVPVSAPVVDNGTILLDDGKIVAMGRTDEIKLPEGCEVLDLGRDWVMPGMVDPHTHIGTEGGFNDMVQPLNPELLICDSLAPESPVIRDVMRAGVTTIHTLPGSGTNHGGFGVITKTYGKSAADMIMKRLGTMKIAQAFNPERGGGDLGSGWMGMSWMLRQFLRDAKEYNEAWTAFEAGRGDRPRRRPELDNLRAVFSGQCVAFVHTCRMWGVLKAGGMFGGEFGLKTVATHTEFGGYQVAAAVAKQPNVTIDIGPRTVDFYAGRDRQFVELTTAYDAAGVGNVSVNTDAVSHDRADQMATQGAVAARFGLGDAKALKAVTLSPARALGIDDRVGSLEVGKDADLVVKAGSLLDLSIPVDLVMVGGEIAYRREGWTP
jgi:imidazolonepropionase-like amidohydrolase